jgi:hypothetical protein
MSIESTVASLISQLKSISNSYRSSARDLVKKADDDLQWIAVPSAETIEFAVDRDIADLEKIPRPPTLPGLDDLELPELGELPTVEQLEDAFSGETPTLASFSSASLDIPTAPTFSEPAPDAPRLSLFPTAPNLTALLAPSLTSPSAVTANPLSGTAPEVPLPVFSAFTGDVFIEYQDGLRLMGGGLQSWSTWLAALLADFSEVETPLIARLQAALSGSETGLPDTWETGQYTQAQQVIQAERYAAFQALDAAPSSVTGLPNGDRVYQNLLLELKTLENTTQAAAKVSMGRHEQEVKHLQWALSTATRLMEVALGIKGQEAAWRMAGALLALEGANATLDVLEQVMAFKEKELEFLIRYNDTQIRRTEDHLKIALTHLEVLKLDEASNQLIAAHNENQTQIYRVAAGFLETRVKLYQAQLDYVAVDTERRKLELQAFEAEIQAYRAKVKAHEATIAAIKARIKGDLVQTDAELLKVARYEGELASWAANRQAESVKIQSQIAQNKITLDGYNTTLAAQLQYLRFTDRFTQGSVAAIIKRFDAESAEQQMKLTNQKLNDQEALFAAVNAMKYQRAELLKTLQTHQVWLSQAQSQSQIIDSGAGTLGSIATQAFSGLNAIGATEILESA